MEAGNAGGGGGWGEGVGRGRDKEVNQKGREKGNYVRLFISALSAAA